MQDAYIALKSGDFEEFKRVVNENLSCIDKVSEVKIILEDGRESNPTLTFLHIAVELNSKDAVEFLLLKGASVNVKCNASQTPLHWAVSKGNVEITKALLEKDAYVNSKDITETTPLHCAAIKGDVGIAKLLIDKGADISAKTIFGATPSVSADAGRRLKYDKLKKEADASDQKVDLTYTNCGEEFSAIDELLYLKYIANVEGGAVAGAATGGAGTEEMVNVIGGSADGESG